MNYPAIEDEEQESYDSIVTLISSIDTKKKEIDFNIAFEGLSEVSQDRAEINENIASIKKMVKEGIAQVGKAEYIKVLAKKVGLKKAKEIISQDSNIILKITELRNLCRCPVNAECFKNPVLSSDGHTFESGVLEQLNMKNPLTRQTVTVVSDIWTNQLIKILKS